MNRGTHELRNLVINQEHVQTRLVLGKTIGQRPTKCLAHVLGPRVGASRRGTDPGDGFENAAEIANRHVLGHQVLEDLGELRQRQSGADDRIDERGQLTPPSLEQPAHFLDAEQLARVSAQRELDPHVQGFERIIGFDPPRIDRVVVHPQAIPARVDARREHASLQGGQGHAEIVGHASPGRIEQPPSLTAAAQTIRERRPEFDHQGNRRVRDAVGNRRSGTRHPQTRRQGNEQRRHLCHQAHADGQTTVQPGRLGER